MSLQREIIKSGKKVTTVEEKSSPLESLLYNLRVSACKIRSALSSSRSGYLLIYTFLFAVVCLIVFSAFIQTDTGFLWIGKGEKAAKDGYSQHYTALMYFGQWGREILRTLIVDHRLEIPMWDFSIGYGSDIITSMHYYAIGDPLNLLSIIVPSKYTELLYSSLVIFRLYLAGLAFSLFCFKMDKKKMSTLVGSFSYILCCYSIFTAVRHPFFINPMIYIPLALMGAEKILRKESPFVFILSVFVSALSNFYFLYMEVFVVVLYFLIRYFTMKGQKSFKNFITNVGKFAGFGLLGIGMGAVIFVPVVSVLIFSLRVQETGGFHQLLYSASYYEKLFISAFSSDIAPLWTCTGFTAPAFVAVVLMFLQKKKHTGLKIGFCLLYFLLLFPVFGKVLNGFSYVSNRWAFILAGLVAFILTSVWDEITEISNKKLGVVSACAFVYYAILLSCSRYVSKNTGASFVLIMMTIIVLFMKNSGILKKLPRYTISVVLAVLVITSGCVNAYYKYNPAQGNYIKEFLKAGEGLEGIETSSDKAASKLVNKEKFSRNEQSYTTNLNASAITGAYGTQYYWSLENGHISRFLMENGMHSYLSQKYDGNKGRTFIDALGAVKYFIKTESGRIPYGFRYIKDIAVNEDEAETEDDLISYRIYKNKYPLPLGYTYSSYITREEYDKMTPAEKQQAMLQGVVLENTSDNTDLEKYKICNPEYSHIEKKPVIELGEGIVQQKDGSYLVNKESEIKLYFEGTAQCENYLYMEGVHAEEKLMYELYHDDCDEYYTQDEYEELSAQEKIEYEDEAKHPVDEDMGDKYNFVVSAGKSKKSVAHNGEKYRYTNGQEEYLANLGYSKKPVTEMTISISQTGIYRFDNLTVVSQPMEQYIQNVYSLKEDFLEKEEITNNTVKGEITLDEDKILCLSIPFSDGWGATVDGIETEILNANTMYMALPLTKGTHKIVLTYTTPMLKESAIVSIVSMTVFLSMVAVYIITKKQRKKTKELR